MSAGAFGPIVTAAKLLVVSASKHKELVVVEGYSHYDLYDVGTCETGAR